MREKVYFSGAEKNILFKKTKKKNIKNIFYWLQYAVFLFPDQGLNLCPLHWDCGVLTTGRPWESCEKYS